MKKAFGGIPKFPNFPKVPSAPRPPDTPAPPAAPDPSGNLSAISSMQPQGDAAMRPPGMPGMMQPPGNAHEVGEIIARIAAAIGNQATPSTGYPREEILRLMREFPIDRFRDAEGNIRCPATQEMRDRLKSRLDG